MQFAIESWNGRAIVFFRAVASVGVIGICFGGDTGRHPPWLNFLVLEGFTGGGASTTVGSAPGGPQRSCCRRSFARLRTVNEE